MAEKEHKKQRFVREAHPNIGEIKTDTSKVGSVMLNILLNAKTNGNVNFENYADLDKTPEK